MKHCQECGALLGQRHASGCDISIHDQDTRPWDGDQPPMVTEEDCEED